MGDRAAATSIMVIALASGWIAAGSVGLITHALQRIIVCILLLATVVVAWSSVDSGWICSRSWRHGDGPRRVANLGNWLFLCLAVAPFAFVGSMLTSAHSSVLVLGLAFTFATLSVTQRRGSRLAMQSTAEALLLLGVWRLAYLNLPLVFLAANAVAEAIVHWIVRLGARSLSAGPTFVGLDFLLVSTYVVIRVATAPRLGGSVDPRRGVRIWSGFLTLAIAHAVYLALLSMADRWQAPPYQAPAEPLPLGTLPPETLIGAARELIPWTMPAIAMLLHSLALAWWFLTAVDDAENEPIIDVDSLARPRAIALAAAAMFLAFAVPILAVWSGDSPTLEGKKIVIFEKGFLNWSKPEYNGEYGRVKSQGMYGMLPIVLESFGANVVVSPELSAEDLQGANVVVLLYPNKPWEPDRLNAAGEVEAPGQLTRIENFVRGGGSLLVMGEHTVREADGGDRINDALRMTNMRCAFDSVEMGVGGWLQSYHATGHPTTVGFADEGNDFGIVVGASIETRWPAYPILIGRFGYGVPGDMHSESLMGARHYHAGARLGDLPLAAEQAVGKGRVIAIGDTSCLTNGLFTNAYSYVSRLMAYLANPIDSPLHPWRQYLTATGALALVGVLIFLRAIPFVVITSVTLATILAMAVSATHQAWELLPDGRGRVPVTTISDRFDWHQVTRQSPPVGPPEALNHLVYIDDTHLGHFSREWTRDDGLMGLAFHLVRSGYLPLMLHDFSEEKLERAGMLISIAPNRAYTERERQIIMDWVKAGGIFITTVGVDHLAASRELLNDFAFSVGATAEEARAGREPKPLGFFKHPYLVDGQQKYFVRFHSAWPVHCKHHNALGVAMYWDEVTPVIVLRPAEKGLFIVIGDTDFAACKNLENEHGWPFEGAYENSDFWRYVLDMVKFRHDPDQDAKRWMPSLAAANVAPDMLGDEAPPADSALELPPSEGIEGESPGSGIPPLDSQMPSLRRALEAPIDDEGASNADHPTENAPLADPSDAPRNSADQAPGGEDA